ncbi:mitochondrial import inner membrane translocase subunit Tim17/Tim22/Tim23 family protein [Carex rostrata]
MPFLSTPSAFDLPSMDSSATGEPSSGDDAVERRLREAEERLRVAMEELQRRNHRRGAGGDGAVRCIHHGPDESCIAHAVGNMCQSFLLSYGVRVGIGILLRAFKLARGQSYSSLLDLKQLVSEQDLIVREEACRIGLLFGGFTGSYHVLRCLLRRIRKKEAPLNAIIAGSIAGLSVLALDDSSRRRTLALYLLVRLGQCAYNSAKSKNRFQLWDKWDNYWRHGDSLLFSLACAQVMYAFVMRPESLPKSYQDFIQKTGPVAEPVYRAVRECCRGGPVDISSLSAFLSSQKRVNGALKLNKYPPIIPCSVIHPETSSCVAKNFSAGCTTFRKTFPLYFSLTFVPFVVLRLHKFLESPAMTSWRALIGAVRSTAFLSGFVSSFQGVICLHRKVARRDHKLVYWFAGAIAASSVLLEKKARRAELALYVLPRAADSLWYILNKRHLIPNIKNTEVVLFCACMGGVMYYLEHEPDTMAPFLRGLIRRFLASRISNPDPPVTGNNSSAYLNSLGVESPTSNSDSFRSDSRQQRKENEHNTSVTYNLESIPGL